MTALPDHTAVRAQRLAALVDELDADRSWPVVIQPRRDGQWARLHSLGAADVSSACGISLRPPNAGSAAAWSTVRCDHPGGS